MVASVLRHLPPRYGPHKASDVAAGRRVRSPGSRARSVCSCQGLRPRRIFRTLADCAPVRVTYRLSYNAGIRRKNLCRGSKAGLGTPLSTLRRGPHGQRRMTRGRLGWLLLHRGGLAPLLLAGLPAHTKWEWASTVVDDVGTHATWNLPIRKQPDNADATPSAADIMDRTAGISAAGTVGKRIITTSTSERRGTADDGSDPRPSDGSVAYCAI